MSTPQYIATLNNVREVALFGWAELGYFRQALRPYRVAPLAYDGRAEIGIYAIGSRWLGMAFRELTIGVAIEPAPGSQQPRTFLLAAFNSSRLLAWLERSLFKTPYQRAAIELDIAATPVFGLQTANGSSARAETATDVTASPATNETWAGTILMPGGKDPNSSLGNIFFAELSGPVHRATFDSARDTWQLDTSSGGTGLGSLAAARFEPHEWRIRPAAMHRRSKTFVRDQP